VGDEVLVRMFEHNDWGNAEAIEACRRLTDAQLDAPPPPGSDWTLRQVLVHVVESQAGYLRILSGGRRGGETATSSFESLRESARKSGAGLLALARAEATARPQGPITTSDGYRIEPWTVLVQAIQHATEHRRQIADRLRSLGVKPPRLDGWGFGESVGAVVPPGSGR